MRGGAQDAGTVSFLFFTYNTNISIVRSYFFSTTAMSNATGGQKQVEGLETHLELIGMFFIFIFIYILC